jgi:CheY-like chemotaxis protein
MPACDETRGLAAKSANASAQALASDHVGIIDLLLSDFEMPVMNGIELTSDLIDSLIAERAARYSRFLQHGFSLTVNCSAG